MTPDERRVAAIERRHELALLDRLLDERTRPVPPPPRPEVHDPTLRNDLIELMGLLAEAVRTNYPRQADNQRALIVPLRSKKAS